MRTQMFRNTGCDVMFSGYATDTVDGGSGDDTMDGGDGDDVFYVDSLNDVVYGGAGTDTVYAQLGADLGNFHDVENIILLGVGPGNIVGNDENNLLVGNDAPTTTRAPAATTPWLANATKATMKAATVRKTRPGGNATK